ncbi:hypothetical protein ACFY2R_23115 [Micromonospora olivasterospora]|uniref:Uncharacterized protein n=1 Tax=Micromonospora olivasterospora TaxID=1880 RepID=A0A562I504_MICOL|nr:hypothetical protein [Micromonospora olivasterospora]TWH66087.1 hypothetical protein JD77_01031 [Micromonospora olivasterospora]
MRRLLALTVAVAALAAGAGCSAERAGLDRAAPAGSTGPGATTGTGGGSPAPAGGNAPAVCAAAQQATGTAVHTYVAELGMMLGAVGANDSATAEAARKRAEAALTGWRAALRQQATRATDPQLRTLLTDLASEVAVLGTDVDAIDEEELDRLQNRLDQLC